VTTAAALGLEDKVALVTGASGGIGRSVVRALLGAGATVVATDRAGLAIPDGARTAPCDLRRPDEIAALAARIDAEHGRLDLLVHGAGITRDSVLWKMDEDAWDEVIAVNLTAAFHLLKACAPLLRRRGGGSVVLLSSINGERGKFGQANYAASKAGLVALGRTAAIELAAFGVRVNSIAAGYVRTPMTEALPQPVKERAIAESLLKRPGEPSDVAGAVLFLCSDLSRHVTGQVLRVDGGQLLG
jgi:NAD(P)-dependent dehydrogenase (short-subunit alcohol dehydrogenase family)